MDDSVKVKVAARVLGYEPGSVVELPASPGVDGALKGGYLTLTDDDDAVTTPVTPDAPESPQTPAGAPASPDVAPEPPAVPEAPQTSTGKRKVKDAPQA